MLLRGTDAKKLIRRIIEEGRFVPPVAGSHARKEMDKDGLTDLVTKPGDDGSVGDIELVVVTGWRNEPGNMW